MTTYVYNKQAELLATIPATSECFNQNPTLYYPHYENSMITSEVKFINPVFADGKLREKTRTELIKDGTETLNVGEIIVGNKIETVEIPDGLIIPTWDGKEWLESRDTEIVLPILEEKMIQLKIRITAVRGLRFDSVPLEIELEQLHKKHDEIIANKGD